MEDHFNQEFILQSARAFWSSVYFLCPHSENFVEASRMDLANKVKISWAKLKMKGQPYIDICPSYTCHWSDTIPLFPLPLNAQPGKVQLNWGGGEEKIPAPEI